jgi:RNA polymerase sigma factor (sigma-70 family)
MRMMEASRAAAAMRQTAPVDEPSDDALMHAYAAGDAAAFELLYARHQAGLYRFVRRLLGRALAAQADEVFQDTWMKLVQQRGRWVSQDGAQALQASDPEALPSAGTASVRTWLYTVAHHRVVDLWRRSGRELSIDAAEESAPWEPDGSLGAAWQFWPAITDQTPSGDDLLFWRRAGERLLHCLDQLPLPQRSSFLLHHEDGLPLEEVATAAGVGFETAKTRLRYAMSKLRTCMGAYLRSPDRGWA